MAQRKPLSEVLPPLILGTATFNVQYHPDPKHMPYTDIVGRALAHNILAFDTSPYYGPSEILLGDALRKLTPPPPREGYFIITKAGRIAGDEFDYSPAWINYSVCRSLERLGTSYLDLVYTHDVEFVSPEEVLAAVTELRRLRDLGLVRYVGISGYPVETLASLAEMILRETGEPLDAVMSYSNFCIQNNKLGNQALLDRFKAAGVDCLPNASMLGMGLLTTRGIDNSPMRAWHPSPPELRDLCAQLSAIAQDEGEHLEEVAIRWALENWARVGSQFGTHLNPSDTGRLGVSVMGVSSVDELEETWALWTSVVGLVGDEEAEQRKAKIEKIVNERMWPTLGRWRNHTWAAQSKAGPRQYSALQAAAAPETIFWEATPGNKHIAAGLKLIDESEDDGVICYTYLSTYLAAVDAGLAPALPTTRGILPPYFTNRSTSAVPLSTLPADRESSIVLQDPDSTLTLPTSDFAIPTEFTDLVSPTAAISSEASATSSQAEVTGQAVVFFVTPDIGNQRRSLVKRDIPGGFVNGVNPVDICIDADIFQLADGQLLDNGSPVYYDGEPYKLFASVGTPSDGTITREFAAVNGRLVFASRSLPSNNAGFCQDDTGQVYITFDSSPPGCDPVILLLYTVVEQCRNGEIPGPAQASSIISEST
ncbi:hypothetical protein FPSE5266_05455 [Fusarium pseudograminearum]|nr:hypothetical protein FPSE5266_05455 [Fusarium pseudograminearum]